MGIKYTEKIIWIRVLYAEFEVNVYCWYILVIINSLSFSIFKFQGSLEASE